MAAAEPAELAMFPLQSALLPDEDLPLRIFEPRYTALVRDCMRDTDPRFGVVLISRGREVGGGDVRCDVGAVVTASQLRELEDRVMALFERIAAAREVPLPGRAALLGTEDDADDAGARLYALASRVPMGQADRYAVLAAPSAADRLAALGEAVDSVAAMIEFQLSE
jgi:Lon protease-like protein